MVPPSDRALTTAPVSTGVVTFTPNELVEKMARVAHHGWYNPMKEAAPLATNRVITPWSRLAVGFDSQTITTRSLVPRHHSTARRATVTATALGTERYLLAEGPHINPYDGTLSWVDIEAGTIHVGRVHADGMFEQVRVIEVPDRVGCAFPLDGGGFLAGVGRRLAVIDVHGDIVFSGDLIDNGRRFNDGVIDPAGRLLIGSLSLEGESAGNVLLRLESDGSVTTLDNDLLLANGLGFSPDGTTLYLVDSLARTLCARDYDANGMSTGPRQTLARFDGCEPDGLAVDQAGDIWVALWRGHGIRRFSPDGTARGDTILGPPHVTSLCFFTDGSGRALVTTASLALTPEGRKRHPEAGMVAIVNLGVNGRTVHRWRRVPLPT